jgi:hypothetical protein
MGGPNFGQNNMVAFMFDITLIILAGLYALVSVMAGEWIITMDRGYK